jgi:hypothetical protein
MTQLAAQTSAGTASVMERGRLTQGIGALVIGGDHPGLAIARSLGKRGIPVYILDDQHSISVYSKYAKRVLRAKDLRDPQHTVDSVLEIGRQHGLRDWVLFPTRDETVMAFSQQRERLSEFFRVTTPEWETTRWAWDKNNTYKLAEELAIPAPRTWNVSSAEELSELYPRLPLAIKPAIKENFFYATGAKAWRAETPEQLQKLFRAAAKQIPFREIMIQEIIPGGGESQLSYCAFFRDGKAHSSLVATRMRQHPREFGARGDVCGDDRFAGNRGTRTAFFEGDRFLWHRGSRVQKRFARRPVQNIGCKRARLGISRVGAGRGCRFPLFVVCRSDGLSGGTGARTGGRRMAATDYRLPCGFARNARGPYDSEIVHSVNSQDKSGVGVLSNRSVTVGFGVRAIPLFRRQETFEHLIARSNPIIKYPSFLPS